MDVQFKFEIFEKIQVNGINSLNILKCHEKLPNCSIEFGVLCKGCTKNLGAKIKKKTRVNSLPSALTQGHSAKTPAEISIFLKILCRVPGQGHSAKKLKKKKSLPSAGSGALGIEIRKKRKILCRVPDQGHSAKKFEKKKKNSLPSARSGALGKEIFLKK